MADSIQLGIRITADGKGAESTISSLNKSIEKVGDSSKKAASSITGIEKATKGLGSAAAVAGKALATMGAAFSVRELVRTADAYAGIQARLKLVSGNVQELARAQGELFRISQQNLTPIQETVQLYSRLANAMREMGRSQQDTLRVTDLVGKAMRISGTDAAGAAAGILQFAQAIGAGVLRGDELNSTLENSPRLAKALADGLKVPISALRSLAEQGELTSDKVINALLSQADTLQREYSNIPLTVSGAFTQLENALKTYIGTADQGSGASRDLAESISLIAKNLNTILDPFASVVSTMVQGWAKIADSIKQVRIALGDLDAYRKQFGVNEAIGKDEWLSRGGGKGKYTTGGGFGGDSVANATQDQKAFFDGIDRGAQAATKSLKGLSEIQAYIYQQAVKNKIDPAVMLGLAQRESNFNPNIRSGIPGHGYETTGLGLYQFIPPTGRTYGLKSDEDRRDFKKATDAAMKLMRDLLNTFNGDMRLALAAWNAGVGRSGGKGVKGALSRGVDPDRITEGGHVAAVMGLTKKWRARLANIDTSAAGMTDNDQRQYNKEWDKMQADQYASYVDHLKLREQAFDDYSKRALAEQRTMMERLEIQRKAAEDQAKAAMASGDTTAIAKAEQIQAQFIQRKHDLLLQGIAIEEEATKKKIANIGMEIAQAQKLDQYQNVDKLRADRQSELAELAALAERRKQIEMSANADIAKNAAEYEDQKRKAQQQAASDYAAQVAAQREITEAESDFFRQKMELVQQMQAASADARKQDIDGQLEQARNQAAIAEAERQQAMEGKTGIEAMQMARENLNARLNDTINLIYMERDAALEKLRIDGDILFSQRQLLEVYKAIAEQNGDRKAVLEYEKQLEQVYASQSKNIRDRIQAMNEAAGKESKAKTENSKDIQGVNAKEVKELQLEMNAFWDQYLGRIREYADLWGRVTGDMNNGWSQMAVAMAEYAKNFEQISQKYTDINGQQTKYAQNLGDMAPWMESLEQGQAAAAAMAKTMLALRNTVKEGSDAYNDMTVAAGALMKIQQAMQIVEGVLAVIHQLSAGDVYSAIPRAMAVAGMVASMGVSTGASASGGAGSYQASEAQIGANGGVFGDNSAQSESITKSLEIVAANSTADLDYSAGMLRALKNIELSMAGVTNTVIRNVTAVVPDNQKLGLQAIGSGLFANVEKYISDFGIASWGQKLTTIIKSGFQGNVFTDITREVKVFGNTFRKEVRRKFSALDRDVADQFTRTIVGIADSVKKAGKVFGLTAKDFDDSIRGFVLNLGTVSLQGLKGEDLQKAISAMFSGAADSIARQVMPSLDEFMQVGEGAYQTMMRVANGIQTAEGMLAQIGMTAIKYTDIIYKQGNVTEEIIRQSIIAREGMNGIGRYMSEVVASAEEMVQVYQNLLLVSDAAALTGLNMNHLSDALIIASGGVSRFLDNLRTYQTDILGGSEMARDMLALTRGFDRLGMAVPKSNEEFVKLVNSINTGTEAGQRLYAQVLSLAGAFVKAQEAAKKLEELRSKYLPTDSLSGYRDQIAQIAKDFKQIIDGTLATLPGGGAYLRRTNRVGALTDRIDDRTDDRAIIQDEIDTLEAKAKLTAKEKQRLANLRQQRKSLDDEISDINKQIDAIQKLIDKNPNTKGIIEEKAKLIEEQGNAILKTIADIWDQMTANINAAKETLINIQNDIYELTFTAGSPDIKLGMATAKRTTAEAAYNSYTGDDIVKLREYADEYHRAIMEEYQAKLDMINAPKIALEKERDLAQKAHDEKIAALEKELGATKELADAVKSIQEYVKGLRLSSNSALSPKRLLDEARKQYEETLRKAQGGDVEAMRQITGASDAYLDAARKYFGSGGKYGQIFDGIVAAMDQLGGTPTGDADSIQEKIDQLNRDHEKYLKSIEEKIAALKIEDAIKDLQRETADKLQKLADNLGLRIEAAADKAREDMQTLINEVVAQKILNQSQLDALREIAKGIGIDLPENAQPAPSPAPGGSGSGSDKPDKPLKPENDPAKYTGPSGFKTWFQYWKDQQAIWKEKWKDTLTWKKYKESHAAELARQGVKSVVMPSFATGGLASAGYAMVGEKGPELVRFGQAAQVYSAEQTAKVIKTMMMEVMPSYTNDAPRQAAPIKVEVMPRYINDRPKNWDLQKAAQTKDHDETIAALHELRTELRALVTTQSGANPQLIERLENIERRLAYMERDAKLKPA